MSSPDTSSSKNKLYVVSRGRRIHILDGDKSGGGHRYGAGKGKSEFPQTWSDDNIIDAIEDIANDPGSTKVSSRNGCIILIAVRNSISISVVVDLNASDILTGHPT